MDATASDADRWSMDSSSPKSGNIAAFAAAALMAVLLAVPGRSVSALDLTLNNRNHAVMDEAALGAFARPVPSAGGASGMPLGALYPWLESVDYLEVQSGPHRVYWEADRLNGGEWDSASLVRRDGIWEVRVGRDVFSAPDRIAVRGVRRDVGPIRIWNALDDGEASEFINGLRTALQLRDADVVWKTVPNPRALLTDPPSDGRPHVVLLGQRQAMETASLLTSSRTIAASPSRWYAASSGEPDAPAAIAAAFESIPTPLAVDAYHPEAALLFILSAGGAPYTAEGAPSPALEQWLARAAEARAGGRLIATRTPLGALADGRAVMALHLPSSDEEWPTAEMGAGIRSVPPPDGWNDIALGVIAGIPAGLGGDLADEAALVMADARRFASGTPGIPLPDDGKLLGFYKAYERIGRLAISGQMDAAEAAALIADAVGHE